MTYSFLDVFAAIVGPGGSINLGAGAGNAEEGITVEMAEEKSTMLIGADGNGLHNLHAGKSGKFTVRLLKTSPTNSALQDMYNYQTSSSLFHGKNTLVVNSPVSGDNYTGLQVAFVRNPNNSWAKDANVIDWEFNAIRIESTIGSLANDLVAALL